jgi:hypothetical protein
MKITPHQITVIRSFCQWAQKAINNNLVFDGSFQLEHGGHVILINRGRYMLRFLESREIQVESLIAPWRRVTHGSYLLLSLLLEILKWSVEDYFTLTYRPDEDQPGTTEEAAQGNPEAEGMGPDHTGEKSQAD